jgi:hypothetical protein
MKMVSIEEKGEETIDTGDVVRIQSEDGDVFFMVACVIGNTVYKIGNCDSTYKLEECFLMSKSSRDYRLEKLNEMLGYPMLDCRRLYAMAVLDMEEF